MSGDIVYRVPNIEDAEAVSDLYKTVYSGKYPYKEFNYPDSLKPLFAREDFVWCLAFDDEKLVGSGVATAQAWNMSAEIGKVVVDRDYRGNGIAQNLCCMVQSEIEQKGYELTWASVRNTHGFKIALNNLGMNVVGYLPGSHRVKEREVHFFTQRLSDSAKAARVRASDVTLYSPKLFRTIDLECSNKNTISGKYPDDVIVAYQTPNFELHGNYHGGDSNLTITSLDGGTKFPQYIETTVLIDKLENIENLKSSGFQITSFLPGWFLCDGKRYDCMRLSLPLVQPKLQDVGLQTVYDDILEGLLWV